MNVYAMKRLWFKTLLGVMMVISLGIGFLSLPEQAGAFQGAFTPSGVYVTVTYSDPINVRAGPSTVNYPVIGQIPSGAVVPALGVSVAREWVQIEFPGSASGKGWVYASFVTVTGGELPVVEAPPTPIPATTNTIDPTLAAAFEAVPTQTRLPTFTPPPPLEVPRFEDEGSIASSGVLGVLIIGLVLIGGVGLITSFLLRK
jgi:uncharacterized protein YraI